jgi:hypothetical protein
MKITERIIIDTCSGNADICAAVRITRWLPGVVWSDLTQFKTDKFTVKYEDQIITDTIIILALQKRGCCSTVATDFQLSQLCEFDHPFIRSGRQFMAHYKNCCQTQLLPRLIYGARSNDI